MKTWNQGNEIPKAVTMTRHLGMPVYTLNYGLEAVDGDNDTQKYRWSSASLPAGHQDYASAVSALINNEYDANEMQAIINNYLLEPEDAESLAEFRKMQEFRAYAKRIARAFVDGSIGTETDLRLEEPNNA